VIGDADVRLGGMDSGIRWAARAPFGWKPSGVDAIGVPSTGLSLGRLLASRAHLRFTRPEGDNSISCGKQGQWVPGSKRAVSRL
jgi:hypothetical protein